MSLQTNSVELLAPAGNWAALVAAVEAGADAVYLGGKHFNMRMHRAETNFSEAELQQAVAYAHEHGVRLYVTLNNLLSNAELPQLKEYLLFLQQIQPDALLVQDLAVLQLVRELGITLPLHASVMLNTHNEPMIELLKEYGVTRVVAGRELTLAELARLKERAGIETEYFIHGDMCIAESGQCIHSGVLFGQSSNRGRCLKPCRWAYELIAEDSGAVVGQPAAGPYLLALKDMCLYRQIPELVEAGVNSLKIEGRMRPAEFVRRIVATYRQALDAYLADPTGYQTDEAVWQELYANRVRDYTTSFALGQPTAQAIGFSGEREPRFFSAAAKEAALTDDAVLQTVPATGLSAPAKLSVRVQTKAQGLAALQNGAEVIYIGGEAYLPNKPLPLADYRELIAAAHNQGKQVVIDTPRTTMRRECFELAELLPQLAGLGADGIMVSNLGSLQLARKLTTLPIRTDFSFNIFNSVATEFLKANGVIQATAAYELSLPQLQSLLKTAALPIEVIVHGSYESMICDHNLPALALEHYDSLDNPELLLEHYALRDKAGEVHPLRIDQYGRNHIYFAKDLCYLPYLDKLGGVSSYRIEAQDYSPELTGELTAAYRRALDNPRLTREEAAAEVERLQGMSPREFGIGTWRFKASIDSI